MSEGRDAMDLAKAAAHAQLAAAQLAAKAAPLAANAATNAAHAEANAIATTPHTVGHLAELLGVSPVPDAHKIVGAKSGQVLPVRRQGSLRDQGSRLVFSFRDRQHLEAANLLSRGELRGTHDAVNTD